MVNAAGGGGAQAACSSNAAALAHTAIGALQPFSELATPRWRVWVGRLENYFRATRETNKEVKRYLLLHFGGDKMYKRFQHLPATGGVEDYDQQLQLSTRISTLC